MQGPMQCAQKVHNGPPQKIGNVHEQQLLATGPCLIAKRPKNWTQGSENSRSLLSQVGIVQMLIICNWRGCVSPKAHIHQNHEKILCHILPNGYGSVQSKIAENVGRNLVVENGWQKQDDWLQPCRNQEVHDGAPAAVAMQCMTRGGNESDPLFSAFSAFPPRFFCRVRSLLTKMGRCILHLCLCPGSIHSLTGSILFPCV